MIHRGGRRMKGKLKRRGEEEKDGAVV